MIVNGKRIKVICLVAVMTAAVLMSQLTCFAAFNTVPGKMYPALTGVEIVSGVSADMEMHLKFSNNVASIDETQEGRYDMTGYNDANLTRFRMAEAESGIDVDFIVTPHPDAEKQTDTSKYFYIFAEELDTSKDYIVVVDKELYANMGNSLGVDYIIEFNIADEICDFHSDGELPELEEPPALSLTESSVPNDSKDVAIDTSLELKFSYNVSGDEVFQYNSTCFSLFNGTEEIKIEISVGEDVNTLIITPDVNLKYDTEYKLVVAKSLMARNGQTMSSPLNLYFNTAAAAPSEGDSSGGSGGSSGSGSSESGGGGNPGNDDQAATGGAVTTGGGVDISVSDGAVDYNDYFSDISENWAKDDIIMLADMGIVSGSPDGTFAPDRQMTRAEVITMFVRMYDFPVTGASPFIDMNGHWADEYVSAAVQAGITSGMNESEFIPNQGISREQFIAVLTRAAGFSIPAEGSALPGWSDENEISLWAMESVIQAHERDIVSGYLDNTFRPQGIVTRAEACHMTANLISAAQNSGTAE